MSFLKVNGEEEDHRETILLGAVHLVNTNPEDKSVHKKPIRAKAEPPELGKNDPYYIEMVENEQNRK